MPFTLRPIRWSRLSFLALPLALAGCGGGEAPTEPTAATTPAPSAELSPAVAEQTESYRGAVLPKSNNGMNDQVQSFPPPGEYPYTNTQAAAQRARMQAQVRDDVQQTSGAVSQGADDLKNGVNQAVGEAQTQAKQAATDATDGVKGFAAELRDDATQTLNGEVTQAKASAQGAADGAKQQVQTAVDGAKDNVRRQAKAAADKAAQQAQDAETKVLNGLLGPAPK